MLKNKTKILFISPSLPPMQCGIGDYTYSLLKNFSDINIEKYEYAVITDIDAKNEQDLKNIKIFNIMKSWGINEIKKLIYVCNLFDPCIIHIQHAPGTYRKGIIPYLIPLIFLFKKYKVVNTFHEGYTLRNIYKLILITIFSKNFISVRPNFKNYIHFIFRIFYLRTKIKFIQSFSPFETYKKIIPDNIKKIKYLDGQKRLIVYFGFIFPHKGVELLFEVADSSKDKILIVGPYDDKNKYHQKIYKKSISNEWIDKVKITGYLDKKEVAQILLLADAIILPIKNGSGIWNSSLHTAKLFKSFVLTTSNEKNGYIKEENTYYCAPNNIEEMKIALEKYHGTKNSNESFGKGLWPNIVNEHLSVYKNIIK